MTVPSVPGAVLQEGYTLSQALLEATHEQGARAVPVSDRTGWWGGRLSEMHNETRWTRDAHTLPSWHLAQ